MIHRRQSLLARMCLQQLITSAVESHNIHRKHTGGAGTAESPAKVSARSTLRRETARSVGRYKESAGRTCDSSGSVVKASRRAQLTRSGAVLRLVIRINPA